MSYKDQLQEGDIIVTYNKKNFVSRAIGYFVSKFGKVSEYRACHVHLYLFDKWIVESSNKGVKIRELKGYSPEGFRLYISRYKYMDKDLLDKLTRAAIARVGQRYAFFQLVVIMFKYVFGLKRTLDVSKKALVCSELVCALFKDANEPLFHERCHEIAPAHFLEHPLLDATRIF